MLLPAFVTGTEPWYVHQGDSLEVTGQLPDGCLDAVITDPPYATTGESSAYVSSGIPTELQFYEAWIREQMKEWVRLLKPSGAIWMTIDWRGALALEQACIRLGQRKPKIGIWDRQNLGMGYLLRNSYECFAIVPMLEFKRFRADEPDLWVHPWGPGDRQFGHSAEKPVELYQRACDLIVPEGGLVMDPFCGTGTTGVAALSHGYRFLGFEREPEYAETSRGRIKGTLLGKPGRNNRKRADADLEEEAAAQADQGDLFDIFSGEPDAPPA